MCPAFFKNQRTEFFADNGRLCMFFFRTLMPRLLMILRVIIAVIVFVFISPALPFVASC